MCGTVRECPYVLGIVRLIGHTTGTSSPVMRDRRYLGALVHVTTRRLMHSRMMRLVHRGPPDDTFPALSNCWQPGADQSTVVPRPVQVAGLSAQSDERLVWSMFAALIGVLGVLIGGILTHLFAISADWRNRRMEAMVASVTASTRVLGAHERLYDIFQPGIAPPLTDDRVIRALTERSEAFLEWRIARARLEIVVSDDHLLKDAMDGFNKTYAKDSWISSYLKEGEHFHFAAIADNEEATWKEMRTARHDIITRCQVRSRQDARWRERIRLALSNRLDVLCRSSLFASWAGLSLKESLWVQKVIAAGPDVG